MAGRRARPAISRPADGIRPNFVWAEESRRKGARRLIRRARAVVFGVSSLRAARVAFVVALLVVALLVLGGGTRWRKEGGQAVPVAEVDVVGDHGAAMLSLTGADGSEFGSVRGTLERETPVGEEARIAYFVQIGGDSIGLVERLLERMWHEDNVYVVHVDSKVGEHNMSLVKMACLGKDEYKRNVHMLESEMVTYKGISMVLNTIAGMTMALNLDPGWDYFMNLSGADYPLLTPRAQRRLLARPRSAAGRLNFMSLFPEKEWSSYAFRAKSQYWDPAVVGHQDAASRLRRFKSHRYNPLEPFRRYEFVKAEAWAILSRSFCEFIIRSSYAKTMLLNHLHMLSAPEHYFIDVLYNHPVWRKTLVPDALRKVVWYHQTHRAGQHPYVLDRSKSEPYEFWMYLKDTRSLFARKFSRADAPVLDRIDTELSGYSAPRSNSSQPDDMRAKNDEFFGRIQRHFDTLTQRALLSQGIKWPEAAYPHLS